MWLASQLPAAIQVAALPSAVRLRGVCRRVCRLRVRRAERICPPLRWQTGMLRADTFGSTAV